MSNFYIVYQLKKYLALFILLFIAGDVMAQFTVTEKCVPSPDCAEDGTVFTDESTKTDIVGWLWNFGDGTTADTRTALHAYPIPGVYTVSLIRTFKDGSTETEPAEQIEIGQLPPTFHEWFSDTTICPDKVLLLDPYKNGAPEGATFFWYPNGETTQTLEVTEAGCYSVEVTIGSCKIQNLVNVKICTEPQGQEGAKWFFGSNAGLDFSSSPPQPITDGMLNVPEGTSAIANSQGKLLFYSDGIHIFDQDHKQMDCVNGPCDDLKGGKNSTQSVLIVPQPTCKGCEYLFNVFTTSDINGEKILTVSTVDMRENKGKGKIISQNKTLQEGTTERIASVKNDRDSTYWVITHDSGTNKFRIFHATTGGLVETSTPELGMPQTENSMAEGYMKFSAPIGEEGERRLAMVIPGPPTNYIELYNFNDSTGTLTLDKTMDLGPAPPKAYGVEFSPDGNKMFVTFQGEGTTSSYLKQYDLTLPDSLLITGAVSIDSSSSEKFGALQIASDGKIYMAIQDSDHLAVIGEPGGSVLNGVEYVKKGVSLGGRKSQLGLPSMVQDFTQETSGSGFQAEGFCSGDSTNFQASPICDPLEDTGYSWDFGDGSPLTFGGKNDQQISHIYTSPGKYKVTLTQINKCIIVPTEQTIEIFETPEDPMLPDNILGSCNQEVVLDMGVVAKYYVWRFNGRVIGRDKILTISNGRTGIYEAIAFNDPQGQCLSSKKVLVTFTQIPDIDLGPDQQICLDDQITLDVKEIAWKSYVWSTGATTKSIEVNKAGTYSVTVTDANGCTNSDQIIITNYPQPNINLFKEYIICEADNESVELNPRGGDALQYTWQPHGEITEKITVDQSGTYTVSATNEEGCVEVQSTNVLDKCEPRVFIPDVFTPNEGDGINKEFEIFGAHYENLTLKVYNRWGEVIFAMEAQHDQKLTWDGTYKGTKVQPGEYAYVVTYDSFYYPERATVKRRGAILVIR
jgi:gliding motility-associated-like protein